MVLQRREVTCADGTFFSEGETDFRCFSHPHALVGTAVVAAFDGLGAVVYLAWIVITGLDARSQPENQHRGRTPTRAANGVATATAAAQGVAGDAASVAHWGYALYGGLVLSPDRCTPANTW